MKAKTIIVILALLAIVGAFYYTGHKTIDPIIPEKGEDLALKTFASEDDLKTFLKSAQSQGRGYMMYDAMGGPEMMVAKASAESAPTSAGAGSYSTTNIQVEGVDEADIIKNDNKYIYAVSGKKVVIVDAYPAEQAEILSTIKLDDTPSDIFINKDKLVVMGNKQTSYDARKYIDEVPAAPTAKMIRAPDYYPRYQQRTFINVYDISDRKKPELVDEVEVKGYYYNSRMVGDYVYVIANDQAYYYEGRPVPMPLIVRGGTEKTLLPTDIMYCPIPSTSYSYTNILSVNTQNKNEDVGHKVILTGASQNMYMSLGNIYLTTMKGRTWIEYRKALLDEVMLPALPSSVVEKVKAVQEDDDYARWGQIDEITQTYFESLPNEESVKFTKEIEPKTQDFERRWRKQSEKTVIHRIAVKDGKIDYESEGEVPGRVLNQFSMDEYGNNFRIATTIGYASTSEGEETSFNNVYVLDMDLDIVGKLEDLAPGEKIYSARFMGKRAYLVTFRNIDPLFVIDLSVPTNPEVLGKLKIPGYSDYLHPYDENHVIGLGKWTTDAKDRDFAYYQGLKMSLFDVSDVTKPKEVAKYEIGDRGTDSYALHDHKAFLFDREKNLLVIPVLLAEIDPEQYSEIEDWQYGDYKFQGAYVFSVDKDNGFDLKGRVTHIEDEETFLKSGYYYYDDDYSVKRSLYMGDILYTVSNKVIKMNDLDDLEEINKVKLPYEREYYNGPYYARGGPEVVMVE